MAERRNGYSFIEGLVRVSFRKVGLKDGKHIKSRKIENWY